RVEIDAVDFQRWANSDGPENLRQALDLYGGELLADRTIRDSAFEEWIAGERARLHEIAVSAAEKLWSMESQIHRVDIAKRLIAIEPLKEFSHWALMQSYADAGENGLALQHYAAYRNLLKAELAISPGNEIEKLRQRILDRGSVETTLG